MFVRLAVGTDLPAYIELARLAVEESERVAVFRPEKVEATFRRYIAAADPTIFVVERNREIVGFLNASIYEYDFADGLFTVQQVLYVRPDNRGTRASALLMQEFVSWSDRLGALENTGGNDNGLFSERTAKFLERFGFERVGFYMRRVGGCDGEKGR